MHKKLAFLILPVLLLFIGRTFGQNKFTVSGTITDKKTGEALIGATIKDTSNSSNGAISNEYGFYSLTLPAGNYKLEVVYLGYKQEELSISLDKNVSKNISLGPSENELSEVTVTDKANKITSAQMGSEKMSVKEMNMIPVIFGEKDIMKTIQLLPGIVPAGDGNSGFFVRGGAADQNLILL